MMNFLSRYHPKYVRSLVYMMQASEYQVFDYLSWYGRTSDFLHVEKRKKLVMTPKATLFLLIATFLVFSMYAVGLFLYFGNFVVSGLVVILLTPFVLPYLMLVPLFLVKVVQMPVEFWIMKKARQKLRLHKGLKIAIAGSFGKTTMREILKTVLSEGKVVAQVPHSYNTPLGISRFIENLKGNEDVLIFEFGEYYPGDILKLCLLVAPDVGIITGVNEAHLEKFGSLDETGKTIFELADWLGEKVLYVNAESDLAKLRALQKHILYSREGVSDLKVEKVKASLEGTVFSLNDGREFVSGLLGAHMVGPLLVSIDLAKKLGLTDDLILKGIKKTKSFDHRLQMSVDASGVVTLDDSYNGNPSGVKAILEFLSGITDRRKIYVTPGLVEMGERSEEVHRVIGKQIASAGVSKVILMKNSVTKWIDDGLKEAGFKGEVVWFDDALKAYAFLPQMTVKGDLVVLQNDWPDQYA